MAERRSRFVLDRKKRTSPTASAGSLAGIGQKKLNWGQDIKSRLGPHSTTNVNKILAYCRRERDRRERD